MMYVYIYIHVPRVDRCEIIIFCRCQDIKSSGKLVKVVCLYSSSVLCCSVTISIHIIAASLQYVKLRVYINRVYMLQIMFLSPSEMCFTFVVILTDIKGQFIF